MLTSTYSVRVTRAAYAAIIAWLLTGNALADVEDTDVAVAGSDGDDVIDVSSPTGADSSILTGIGENASSTARAVDALGGNDNVDTSADLTVTSDATAAIVIDPNQSTASASSIGAEAGAGNDVLINSGIVTTTANGSGAYAGQIDIPDAAVLAGQDSTLDVSVTVDAQSTGLSASDGDDVVTNSGNLSSSANSLSGGSGGGLGITTGDELTISASSTSKATTTGISGGGGDDQVSNSGTIDSTSFAGSEALSVGVSALNPLNPDDNVQTNFEASANAEANATGIDTEDEATETDSETTTPLGLDGLSVNTQTTSTRATGDDSVINTATITSGATALSGSGSAAVGLQASGSASAAANADATSQSAGISTGGGADSITNTGVLDIDATAAAGALAVTVDLANPDDGSGNMDADDEDSGGSTTNVNATASAVGIDAEGSGHSASTSSSLQISSGSMSRTTSATETSIAGADSVDNFGSIDVQSTATSGTQSASVSMASGGSASSESNAAASGNSTGIFTGGGDDVVNNNGVILSQALTGASAVSKSIGAGTSTNSSNPDTPAETQEIATESSATVTSTASATGIDTEGEASLRTEDSSLTINAGGLSSSRQWSTTGATGNDQVNNTAAITANSDALADSQSASITMLAAGSVGSNTSSTATAGSHAIATGGGADTINNTGTLTSDSTASASALALDMTVSEAQESSEGSPPDATEDKSDVSSKATVTATASALGIDAEGGRHNESGSTSLDITGNSIQFSRQSSASSLAGIDVVDNRGTIETSATATSGATAAGISIAASGSVSSDATSAATAHAGGIATGGAGDSITNTGTLTSTSLATAGALSVGVSVSQPDSDDGDPSTGVLDELKDIYASASNVANAEATATASGIDAEGDAHDVDSGFSTTLDSSGMTIQFDHSSSSDAGDDFVDNVGNLTADSVAVSGAGSADVDVGTGGTAASESNSTASSDSTAIGTGGGGDQVINSGELTVDADSVSAALSVTFAQGGSGPESKSDANSRSDATASGIATDGGTQSDTTSSTISIGITGVSATLGRQRLANSGADSVQNAGIVNSTATATSGAAGGAVTIDGAASSDLTSTAASNAYGIDVGGGDDLIDNAGPVDAAATSIAAALSVGFGQNSAEGGSLGVDVAASSTAAAAAVGIAGDSGTNSDFNASLTITQDGLSATLDSDVTASSGNDTIVSDRAVTSTAFSNSDSLGVAVAIDGAASADVNSTATSDATAILGGGGNDQVDVRNDPAGVDTTTTATATAIALGIPVAVGQGSSGSSASTSASADMTADAAATGIDSDGGPGDISLDATLDIDGSGLRASYSNVATASSGDDVLQNDTTVTVGATAVTGATSVAVTIKGAARSSVEAAADATARGLDSGGGTDDVDNAGNLNVDATATAATASVAVTTDGVAVSNTGLLDAGTSAMTDAVGISSAGSDHVASTSLDVDIDFSDFSATTNFERVADGISGDGADDILNFGDITVNSDATTLQATVGVTTDPSSGLALTIGRTEAEAYASGVDSGNGDDVVENQGTILSTADADAATANVSVTTSTGAAIAGNAAWDGGTVAKATATGINSDSGSITTTTIDAEVSPAIAQLVYETETVAASGDDLIINTGTVDARATGTALTATLAATVASGVAAGVSTSNVEANAAAIQAGDGDDDIQNSGNLESHADATAATANISFTRTGVAAAADAVWDGGTTAESTAVGIDADGGNLIENTRLAIGTAEMGYDSTSTLASGADNVVNFGNVNASADSTAASLSAAITITGASAGTATSTASATSTAIHTGAGTEVDELYNAGGLTSAANATATSASISLTNAGLAVSADSVWDGGTTADAHSRGIDVGAGGETITNDGSIDSSATATTLSTAVSVAISGVAGASATATGVADSTAIDASAGNDADTVINTGDLTSGATSTAAAASISFTNAGAAVSLGAVWDNGTGSDARSRGIDVGDNDDQVQNSGTITTSATANAAEAAVSVAVAGAAGAVATARADSDAIAIDAGQDAGSDLVVNDGDLFVDSTARAASGAVSGTQAGVALTAGSFWDGGTTAEAGGAGIATGDGADVIGNTGDITLDTDATAAAASVSVALTGVAGATATSTAISDATAIDAGDDDADDQIDNSGIVKVTSTANAAAASVSGTQAGLAVSGDLSFDGGRTSDASARGLAAGLGDDVINNFNTVDVSANSNTAVIDVSVAMAGVSAVISTESTSRSSATAIDAGGGNHADTVYNDTEGTVDASALSLGAAASVGVTATGVSATWNGGVRGDATARGIDVGDGADQVQNDGDVTATADGATVSAAVTVAVTGVGGAISTANAESDAVGIDTGDDDEVDTVLNNGTVSSDADATAASAAVSVTVAGGNIAGTPPWDSGTSADAVSTGVFLGGGDDVLLNNGTIAADSDTVSGDLSVSVAVEGVAAAITSATSDAASTGVDSGTGNDVIESLGSVSADAFANATTASFAGSKFGVSVTGNDFWDGGTQASASATGIATGAGQDTVIIGDGDGDGGVDAFADAVSTAVTVAFNVGGVSAAVATSGADAEATAIDTGVDDDQVDNRGTLTVDSQAVATTVNSTITGAGVSFNFNSYDGGTTGTSTATGISTGQGADLIINSGDLDIDGRVVAPSTSVALVGIGAGVASSTSTADTAATGIDAGVDDDVIDNSGNVDVTSNGTAIAVNVSLSGGGFSGAADAIWDGGTTATSIATGIDGGSGNDVIMSAADRRNDTTANATADSIAVAVSGVGYGVSLTKSTANAIAAGIDAGDGADLVMNDSDMMTTADSNAVSVGVSVVGAGLAASGTPGWDGGTTANADAASIALGTGDDQASNSGTVDTKADARADAVSVSATLLPIGGIAVADAVSTADANATSMAGDAGDDILVNDGALTADSDAKANGISVSLSIVGAAGSGLFDNSTGSLANSTGMAGGDGADGIRNAGGGDVTVDANADTGTASVAITLAAGVAAANSNSVADAAGTALDGGTGDDTLVNEGVVNGVAIANASGQSIAFTQFSGTANAGSSSHAALTGMSAGDGNDIIDNQGNINLAATATATGQAIGFSSAGIMVANADTHSETAATALSGDDGADTIMNSGVVDVDAVATTTSVNFAFVSAGVSRGTANATSIADAAAVDGGAADDIVINSETGSISAVATARTIANSVSLNGFGASGGEALTRPEAAASGIRGGLGADQVQNDGSVHVLARTRSSADGGGVNYAGASSGRAGTEVESTAVGIDGQAGADIIVNTGSVRVGPPEGAAGDDAWASILRTSSLSMSMAGLAQAESEVFARTTYTGLGGGDGDDQVSNTGDVTVIGNALSDSSGSSLAIFGSSGTDSASGAQTIVTGIAGGAGNDYVESLGSLSATGNSRLVQSGGGTSFTLAGANTGGARLESETSAIGISGGAGADTIIAEGSIDASAVSALQASGGQSMTIFGSSGATSTTAADTYAAGIDGGDDDDVIDSGADVTIHADSRMNLSVDSYTFTGASDSNGRLVALTAADGLLGGAGADQVRNRGTIDITALANLDSTSASSTSIGGASGASASGANVRATGIDGGDDDDLIENSALATIAVSASADVRTSSVSNAFIGGAGDNVAMRGSVAANGIDGGAGNDQVANDGNITVDAEALLVANGGASSTITGGSSTNSAGSASTTSAASGIDGGAGSNTIMIGESGRLLVTSDSEAESRNTSSSSASITSTNTAGATARTNATASGLTGDAGDNLFVSDGSIAVQSNSNAYGFARANGASVSFSGTARSNATGVAVATSTGASAGDGADTLVNTGDLAVDATASTSRDVTITFVVNTIDPNATPQDAEPVSEDETVEADMLPDPASDPVRYMEGYVVFWTQSGNPDNCVNQTWECVDDPEVGPDGGYYELVIGPVQERDADGNLVFDDDGNPVYVQAVDDDGNPIFDDDGNPVWEMELQWEYAQVFVVEREEVLSASPTTAIANGRGASGDGVATANGESTATATGVTLGDGNNVVENHGTLTVTATADASVRATSSGSGIGGDATSNATSVAHATAYGVVLGGGDDQFWNSGDIDVAAVATADAVAQANASDDICIRFLFWRWCGGGGNEVRNPGTTLTARAFGIVTGDGNDTLINDGNLSVTATTTSAGTVSAAGIQTGPGDDVVINNGTVSAMTINGNTMLAGIGIDTGAGNDALTLGAGSVVVGSVGLGAGDDSLTLAGTPMVTDGFGQTLDIAAGDGVDTLFLQGTGSFPGVPLGFEHATKLDSGVFSLPTLATLQSLTIDGGMLALGSGYDFSPTGSFSTFIHSDGSYGGFAINGASVLDGAIDVDRRGGDFIDGGTRYPVVTAAGALSNVFADITLPAPVPLLSFELQQDADSVDVVAVAASFTTTAGNSLSRRVAGFLDVLAADASGDLDAQIGTIQAMTSGFDTAYASLAPDSYEALTSNTISTAHQATQLLRGHLGNARAVNRGRKEIAAAYDPVLLAYNGSELRSVNAFSAMAAAAPPVTEADIMRFAAEGGGGAPAGRSRMQAWLMGFTGSGEYDLVDGYTDSDYDTGGFVIGGDYRFSANVIGGISFGYGDTSIDSAKAVARSDAEARSGTLYVTAFSDRSYVEGGLYFASQSIKNRRELTVGTTERTARSKHDGDTWMAFLGAGRQVDFDTWHMEPYATLYYFDIDEDGFSETGAGSLNQVIEKKSASALIGEVGTTFVRLQDAGEGMIDWHASIAYNHDFDIDDTRIRYAFEGAPDTFFDVRDRNITGGSTAFGAGIAYIRNRTTLSLDYRGQFNSDYTNHIGGFRIEVAF